MAGSQRDQRRLVDLPRNWRLISAAGVTAFGLACGVGHSALGEWWSLPRMKSSVNDATPKSARAPVTDAKSVSLKSATARSNGATASAAGNGFSATIHRLQADAQQQAEKGDLDRAVQLAERAAKISEASSQLNGSLPDCSPERTAQFANDLRSRREAIAGQVHRVGATPPMTAPAPLSTTTISSTANASMGSLASPSQNSATESARDLSPPTHERINSHEQDLAWATDLPPTPAPELESFQAPTKFRRIVLNRAATESDELEVESHVQPDEGLVVPQSEDVIGEPFDLDSDLEQSVEVPPISVESTPTNEALANGRAARAEASTPVEESLREPFRDQIQHVAADGHEEEPSPSPFTRRREWEDEELNAEPIASAKAIMPVAPRSADRTRTQPDTEMKEKSANSFTDESFPVQRVVQLRRRLESAASLNPGGAFTLTAQAEAAPSGAKEAADRSSVVSTKHSRSSPETSPQAVATPEQVSPPERHLVKLREHRQQSGSVQQTPADVLPPVHSTRHHSIGFSEPILWQSVEERSPVVPTLSLVSDIRIRDDGARLALATSSAANLRGAAGASEGSRTSTDLNSAFRIPASRAEPPHFGSIELRGNEARGSEAGGSVLFASSHSTLQSSMADGPALGETNRSTSAVLATDPPQSSARKKKSSVAKPSHAVSRQSFALIEPLAASLNLSVATTASLLGGVGLALLGFGLLLTRAAFRWRHAG